MEKAFSKWGEPSPNSGEAPPHVKKGLPHSGEVLPLEFEHDPE